jgi:hypothetical protein
MKSKLGQLRKKLDNSGICGNPIITDDELKEMVALYHELVDFMEDTNNATMKWAFSLDMEQGPIKILQNRKLK